MNAPIACISAGGYADDAGFWQQCGVEVPEIMLAFAHRSHQAAGEAG